MRFLKALWLIFFISAALVFFQQNHDVLAQTMELKLDPYIWNKVWVSSAFPLYFIILLAFFVGGFFSITFLMLDRMKLSMELRAARRDVRRKDRELKALKEASLKETALLEPVVQESPVTVETEK